MCYVVVHGCTVHKMVSHLNVLPAFFSVLVEDTTNFVCMRHGHKKA
jgi:hypothetical protein